MPLFYFDIHDKHGYHRDEIGDDLEGVSQVRDQVYGLLPDIARSRHLDGTHEAIVCCVRDADGEAVYRGELIIRGTTLDGEACRHGDVGSPIG